MTCFSVGVKNGARKIGFLMFLFKCCAFLSLGFTSAKENKTTAFIDVWYEDRVSGLEKWEIITGLFGTSGRLGSENGTVVHAVSGTPGNLDNTACSPEFHNVKSVAKWVALVRRGGCNFGVKITNAIKSNASAVIIYNKSGDDEVLWMRHPVMDTVAVFIGGSDGDRLAALTDEGTDVHVHIGVANRSIPLAVEDEAGEEPINSDWAPKGNPPLIILLLVIVTIGQYHPTPY